MGAVRIRKMTLADVPQVMEIERSCFSIPWSEEAFETEIDKNKFARYVVVEADGKVAGYGGMWLIVDEAHITNIAVHPEERGKGYGDLIVKALIAEAEKEKIGQMTLEVRVSNYIAQNLYRKYGFEACGIRPEYYGDNHEDAVIMWRQGG